MSEHRDVYLASHTYLDWVNWCFRCGARLDMYTSSHMCGPATENYIRMKEFDDLKSRQKAVRQLYRLAKRGR